MYVRSTPIRWPLVSGAIGVMNNSGGVATKVAAAPSTDTADTIGPSESRVKVARSSVMRMSTCSVAEILFRTGS